MESFYIGCCFGYFSRILVLKTLKWPLTSCTFDNKIVPIRSIPPILLMGLIFSTLDMMRRAKLEEIMIREERAEINKELRQSIMFGYL